ncbi:MULTISPECIES: glutamate ABC transporter substrate-binding protein [Nocardioides]|uniref:Glutamate ABC transporter substrate-binding protein n=1 Tax=Nocardioides vastitatis TaxID=2568655 RepID=A0ABW0ZM26_9ACTN|nr:glutamate ABC transporter substrate-binding protein [Nocardioides sp.]THJ07035.1 glutamate ABC transporter substrate-binding protein [Nocardioides sp.]
MSRDLRSARRSVATAVLAAALLVLSACGYDATPLPEPEASSEPSPAAPASCTTTAADLRSYAPSREGGDAVDRIRKAGVLRVGVSADTLLMGARNPETNRIEGFDIDIAQRIAKELGVSLQVRVINAAERIELLESGAIDIVARNMTINCARWEQIAFSAEYYHAGQKVLLRKDLAKGYRGPQDLAEVKVCAPTGTTSIDNIRKAQPAAVAVTAANHTGCMVKFQQGEVDAITGDDTVLAGLAAQDELYARVPQQEAFTPEPYGIGAKAENVDLVRFVNDVLEEMRRDGSWQVSYDKWLRPYLGAATPPAPAYGR